MPSQRGFAAGDITRSYAADVGVEVGKTWAKDGKIYRFVKNTEASTTLALGQAAYHVLSDAGNHEKYVKLALTANLHCLAGIVMATAGIPAGYFGWVQCHGNNESVSVSGETTGGTNLAAGEFLKGANATAHLIRDTVTTGRGTYARTVQMLEAVATTTTPAAGYKRGFIMCL